MSDTRTHPVATGVALFAGALLALSGIVQVLNGIVGLSNDVVWTKIEDYVFAFDATVWGWIHLLIGALFVAAGICILLGQTWARSVGIGLAIVSGMTTFMWLPYYPLAAVLIIALDVLVIWALANYQGPETV